jgi:hypothetical protein
MKAFAEIPALGEAHSDPFDFATQILVRLTTEPTVTASEVAAWGKNNVTKIVEQWAAHPAGLAKELGTSDPLGVFREQLLAYHAIRAKRMDEQFREFRASPTFKAMQEAVRWTREMRAIHDASAFARLIDEQRRIADAFRPLEGISRIQLELQRQAETIAAATRGIQNSVRQALEAFETQSRFVSHVLRDLPDPAELRRRSVRIESGLEALDDSGYGFTAHIWDIPFVVELGELQPGIRGAVATNRFAAFCRDPEFYEELQTTIEATPVLRRRWPLISAGLGAHASRNYGLAIPVLLAQLEGCITDMLVLRGEAALHRGKLYAKTESGAVKKGRDDKPIRLIGLDAKLKHSRWQTDDVLQSVAGVIADHLVAERNDIMHGRNISYGKAKLATQVILIVWVLAREVRERIP